jgi:tRNA nucleotidyltransferase (CCA-adding enzyme)
MITDMIPLHIKNVAKKLSSSGFEAWLAGGSCRDLLMGIEPHDFDFTTNATPDQIKEVFKDFKNILVGEEFGTVAVIVNDEQVEITTFRSEHGFTDGRHPDSVVFEKDLKTDLSRRDFTINAMAMNPITGEIIDFFNGRNDIELKEIHAVGNPNERFNEDFLRMFRGCRFAGKLGFRIGDKTFNAIAKNAHKINEVSMERIKDEWFKLMECEFADMGVWELLDTGLLAEIEPELACLNDVPQPIEHHSHNVLKHNVIAMMEIPTTMPLLRFITLHHDIAKLHMNSIAPHFPNHAPNGAIMFRDIANRLKMSNEETEIGVFLIAEHMRHLNHNLSDFDPMKAERKVRRWLCKIGESKKWLPELFLLWRADLIATGKENTESLKTIEHIKVLIEKIITEKQPISLRDLAINGFDLMNLGIPRDESMGLTMKALMSKVIENPELNEKETLLSIAKEMNTKNGKFPFFK